MEHGTRAGSTLSTNTRRFLKVRNSVHVRETVQLLRFNCTILEVLDLEQAARNAGREAKYTIVILVDAVVARSSNRYVIEGRCHRDRLRGGQQNADLHRGELQGEYREVVVRRVHVQDEAFEFEAATSEATIDIKVLKEGAK